MSWTTSVAVAELSPPGRSRSFERIADRYDETRGGEDRGRRFAANLLPLLDARLPTLEIGIGTGVVAMGLAGLGCRVFGVDISPAMLSRARGRLGPRVAIGDARRLPVAEASFAGAYSVWVLHVVGNVPAVLAEERKSTRLNSSHIQKSRMPSSA